MTRRAVSLLTYNRANNLGDVLDSLIKNVPSGTDVFVCDDGSVDNTREIVKAFPNVNYYYGSNQGVAINKNRALFLMKNYHFSAMLEDDLCPTAPGWFDIYERVSILTGTHHFCRVQDKEVPEAFPSFTEYLKKAVNVTPIYASSPRGDLTFLTKKVISTVGGLNPQFRGVGYAHGEWSDRVAKAGLIPHPLKWIDIREARDMFRQVGDTEGGRWQDDFEKIKKQMKYNKKVAQKLRAQDYTYCPLRIT